MDITLLTLVNAKQNQTLKQETQRSKSSKQRQLRREIRKQLYLSKTKEICNENHSDSKQTHTYTLMY